MKLDKIKKIIAIMLAKYIKNFEKKVSLVIARILKEVKQGPIGIQGLSGKDGKDGLNGKDGLPGKDGINGKDGLRGKDGSSDTPEQIRNKLQTLKNDQRLDVSAIKGIKEMIDRLVPVGGIQYGGGMGQGDIYVETPVGEINSVNKTFTVSHDITLVVGFAIGGEAIHPDEYTTSGKIITFVTALHGDLSGKSFTIVYV